MSSFNRPKLEVMHIILNYSANLQIHSDIVGRLGILRVVGDR